MNGLGNLTAAIAYREFRNIRLVHVYCDITTHDITCGREIGEIY